MKKKIFLTLAIVMVLTCLFAIGVSAARVEDYDDTFTLVGSSTITHYERHYSDDTNFTRRVYTDSITVNFVDENGNAITEVPMWEYDEAEGKYYSLVWYISAWEFTKEDTTTTISDVVYTFDKYTAAKYTLKSIRAVDIRYDFSYSESWSFSTSSVGYDYSYKVEKPLWGMFIDVNSTPDDTTDDYKLQGATGLGRDNNDYGYIGWDAQFEATGNKIVVANLRDCDFDADCTGNYGTKATWKLATNLQCLWYPDTVKYIVGGVQGYEIDLGDGVEIINCQILRDNTKVKEFTVPNSVIYLYNEAFRGTDLTKLTIGEGLITHGSSPFLYTGCADNIYISKNVLNSTYIGNITGFTGYSANIYFDGNAEQANALMEKMIAESSGYNGKFTLVDYKTTQERGDVKNICLFYNYNRCEAFYRGTHGESETNCEFTGTDYFTEYHSYTGCARCKDTVDTKVCGALFTSKGYSKSDDAIVFVIVANLDAIEAYNEYRKGINADAIDVKYGIVVSQSYNSGDLLDENGTIKNNSILSAEFSGTSYELLQIKITGISEAAYKTPLHCCAFVADGTSVSYLYSDAETKEGAVGTAANQITHESIPGDDA